MWCVYVHISPSNKYYVGITSKEPKVRWGHNGNAYQTQYFSNAIKKYGWDNWGDGVYSRLSYMVTMIG